MLTVETFSISSNIITESPTSLLRFIIDDAALYISDKRSASSVNLKKSKFIKIQFKFINGVDWK